MYNSHLENFEDNHLNSKNNKLNSYVPYNFDLLMCSWKFFWCYKPLHMLEIKKSPS